MSTSRRQKGTYVQNSTKTKRAIERMLFLRGSSLKGDFIVEDDLQI